MAMEQSEISDLRITLFKAERDDYSTYVIAGLFELQAQGVLTVRNGRNPPTDLHPDFAGAAMWMKVEQAGSAARWVFFDLTDFPELPHLDDVRSADVYFKRSYQASVINKSLPPELAARISPMTMQYAVRSKHESYWDRLIRTVASMRLDRGLAGAAVPVLGALCRPLAQFSESFHTLPQLTEDLLVDPNEAADETVYLRTRIYDPDLQASEQHRQQIVELNQFRVELIHALKQGLGPRFIGGLYPTAATRKYYPELISEVPEGTETYAGHLQRSRQSLINVNQAGVRDSTGWKIAECLAASRCLVSQPPVYQNLVDIRAGEHFVAFSTPTECVDACLKLLEDPQEIARLRRAGFEYYRQHVEPRAALAQLLHIVLSR